MLLEILDWGIKPSFITGDSWYSCVPNLKLIKKHQLGFMFALKSNRLISIEKGEYLQIQNLDILKEGLDVWLRDFGKVKVFRTMLKDQQRHYAVSLPDEPQLEFFDRDMFVKLHEQHWQIEQYHRVIKQVCHIEHFHVRSQTAIRNHIFASICGYVRLQFLRVTDFIHNCYSLQKTLFNQVISSSIQNLMSSIKHLNSQIHRKIPL
jgi:hypothetical protein